MWRQLSMTWVTGAGGRWRRRRGWWRRVHYKFAGPTPGLSTNIDIIELDRAPAAPQPSTAEVRARARAAGLPAPERGRLRPNIWQARHDANAPNRT